MRAARPADVRIRFFGDLATLAWEADRDGVVEVLAGHPRSVKDAVESCGVPHTEVGLVLVDGESVGFGATINGGERVSVYPPFTTLDVAAVSHVEPSPIAPRFLLDVHLGRLAGRLRQLGFDSAFPGDVDDVTLAEQARQQTRWLLTRDRGLLMRAVVTHGYLVRALDPRLQAFEVVRRFRLGDRIRPFTRCTRCNGLLAPVEKEEVTDRLEPGTRAEHDHFTRCTDCGQVYWAGSHLDALHAFVAEARRA